MKPDLQLLFELEAQLAEPVGDTPDGLRRMIPIKPGTFEGPRIRGKLLAGGADWQLLRSDGFTIVEALYLLRTDEGGHHSGAQSRHSSWTAADHAAALCRREGRSG